MKKTALTQTQLGLYFESSREKEAIYYLAFLTKLAAETDLEVLKKAIETAISAHSFPYVRFKKDEEGMPYQYLSPNAELNLKIEKMSDAEFEKERQKWPEKMEFEDSPLYVLRLIETPSAKWFYHNYHHTIMDGTSLEILQQDITKALRGEAIPKEKVSIIDVAKHEAATRKTPAYDEGKKWYAETFSCIDTETLPLADVNTHSEAGKTPKVVLHTQYLDTTFEETFAASRRLGVKVSILTDGAFGYMAGMFAGTNEAQFTTIYNGRKSEDEAQTIGMLVKTLPVYSRWDADTKVVDYLHNLHNQREGVKQHDIYSFAEATKDLQLKSALMFCYRGSKNGEVFNLNGLDVEHKELGILSSGDGITFLIDHVDGKLKLLIEYRADKFSKELVQSLADSYDFVLKQMISVEKLSDITLVDTAAQLQYDQQHHTELQYDTSKSVVDLWRDQVAKTPDNIAVVVGKKRFTFAAIDDLSDRVAAHLRANGIRRGDVVSIIIPRNEFMVIAALGVLKSSAAYQPLDPSYPTERLYFMTQDANSKFLIADDKMRTLLKKYRGNTLCTSEIENLRKINPKEALMYRPEPDDRFILLYTSGSTGLPKGCQLTHRNIVDFINVIQPTYQYDSNSRTTAYASFGFDANFFEQFPALTHGATIHIIRDEIRFDMVALNNYFKQEGITHTFMTTQIARAFATSVDAAPTLRFLSCGGETLVPLPCPTDFTMLNLYGPTETTCCVTMQPLEEEYDRVPIGHALPNVHLYVVDKNGNLLPPYATGELWIAGPQVSIGYLNRPEKTVEVFHDNPFTTEEKYNRIYRTGDTVRRLADGRIDFIGRNDGQVKVRGFRIELSEIEGVIRQFANIKDATVVALDDPAGGKMVVAYVVSDKKINIASLRTFISVRKPPYMVPASIMQIDQIPLNQNQKVDKRALPKPEVQLQKKEETAPHTLNPLEKALQEIVASVLKIEEVDVTTSLELLGLTSISSIKMAMAIYKRFGFNFNSNDLLGETSIETIGNKILEHWLSGEMGENIVTPTEKAKRKVTLEEKLPLTISQQGVYADSMRNPDSIAYNIPLLYRFPKSQNPDELADCVRTIIEHHSYFNTYFTLSDADIEQMIASENDVKISLKTMSDDEFSTFKLRFIQPFNLLEAPLYRVCIVSTETAVYLLMDIHHIIFDGSSVGIFLNELQMLLNGGEFAAEKSHYFDYVHKELGSDQTAAQQFFADMLCDCEAASEITTDMPPLENGVQGENVETCEFINFDAINDFSKQQQITPAALMLAAVGYTVSRFTGAHEAYLSTISTGRNDMHFADTIGMFVKTLPAVVKIGDTTAAEFVQQTSDMLRGVVKHEMYPYSTICNDYNYAPNILFAYQLGLEDDIIVNGETVSREELGADVQKFKIEIFVDKREGKPAIVVSYNNGYYSESLMRVLAQSIRIVTEQIVQKPNQKVRTISMLSSGAAEQLRQFATTEMNFEAPIKIFHKMFEKQVDSQPDKEIVVAQDGKFTYRQLEERANRVANALISNGLQRGERVVVLLNRTSQFFTTVFGISKAGGVFIPSSPEYPQERIRTIMEDSAARFLITEGDLVALYNAIDVETLTQHDDCTRPNIHVLPTDLVYMIYTSGSTGKPKGVELRHESICNYLTDHEANPQVHLLLQHGSCYGAVITVAFDGSFQDWALALCNGIKLVFASDEATLNPQLLAQQLNENKVDIFLSTPSRMLQYMELDAFEQAIKNCKIICAGGEKFSPKLRSALKEKTDAIIINVYGPTETTVGSNAIELTQTNTISIGRPLLNYEEYIVDADDNLLPVGVIGELVICGVGVANGYHNLPEQTAKAFFSMNGKRAYRSGDYARWLPDGAVEILGRKDNQVKLRGLRIELGEIERVLTNVDGVKNGVVLIRKVGNQDAICAYYTLKNGATLTVEELKNTMAQHLTSYMVPTAFVELDELPITANGKTNIKALPEPKQIERAVGRAPENKTEKLFAKIFAQILETEVVYANDNFFEIGGTSLLVTRVIIAAGKAGYDLAYADVFNHPTPEKLARFVSPDNKEKSAFFDFEDLGDYNYDSINNLLTLNTLENFKKGEKQQFSHVLLTGGTGFLGIHVLYELLHNYPDCRVTCLLRGKGKLSADARLKDMFFYYFEEMVHELAGSRLSIVEGDITQKESFEQCKNVGIDLVINCAANVKHFSKGTDIEDVNYYGTLNLIDFCEAINARLVHISTTSVGGAFIGEKGNVTHLHENMLYYGQKQVSKYTQSKFLAERAVLQAVADGKLSAKIMRVGNLAPRNKDGEYQINFNTNSFMARIKSTHLVGAHSFDSEVETFELSPIDAVAQAILLLTNTPKENVIFHPYKNHTMLMSDLYQTMSQLGLPSQAMENEDYQAALGEAEQDPDKARVLTGLLAYRQSNGVKIFYVDQATSLTVAVLARLGFRWPVTNSAYTERFIAALNGLGFFD